MKFLLALVVVVPLNFAWQSAAFADSHGGAKRAAERTTEIMKGAGKEDEEKKGDEEAEDCE